MCHTDEYAAMLFVPKVHAPIHDKQDKITEHKRNENGHTISSYVRMKNSTVKNGGRTIPQRQLKNAGPF